ncbi:MAG: transglycosylase domain-containing protein [Candidatus Gracilibacteria bacterium]|nr:transglycosylase domain-containing protein [Candidatus Gracilibacteria bacterium]MDD2908704.1 transglycosylase domain-containing protein [Candidatus Gracilibacteria bacterium]
MKIKNILRNKFYAILFLVIIVIITIPVFCNFRIKQVPLSTIIYDKSGIEIGEIPAQDKYRHRELLFTEIPDFYIQSIISLEDKSFYYNIGISPSGIIRSTVNNIKAGKVIEGGSTISTQFIRNNLWLNEGRNFSKKLLEFLYAINLNLRYSKNEILTLYSNQLYFGYLNYGLKSASFFYFDKDINNLTKSEILALIIIQKNSSKYDPYKFKTNFDTRFGILAKTLLSNSIINQKEYEDIIEEKLVLNNNHNQKLPYIVDFLNSEKIVDRSPDQARGGHKSNVISNDREKSSLVGNKISTTIDYNLTNKIEEIATNSILDLAWKNVKDYGVIILDKKTNNLSVMIGGKNFYGVEGQVNSTLSLRQPGSTIKPFTYLLAAKNLGLEPTDTILDLPVLYKTKDNYSYEPKNYSTIFEGEVSAGEALAQSINVPAIKTLEALGVDTLLNFLHMLGIKSLDKSADHYGLALTLGDGEVTLYELVRAYTIFANKGSLCDINYINSMNLQCRNIIEDKYIEKINYILSNRFLKIGGYPINSSLDFTDINVFFKTGTSRSFRDNWTVGYTDNYIIGVWTGNKDASNMKGVSGATGAGEIFGRIVRYLEKPTNYKTPVLNSTPVLSSYLEITSPLDSSVFKIDNYILKSNQKISLEFSTNIKYDSYYWLQDNQKVNGDLLSIIKGKHKLELILMKDGQIKEKKDVGFEVIEE